MKKFRWFLRWLRISYCIVYHKQWIYTTNVEMSHLVLDEFWVLCNKCYKSSKLEIPWIKQPVVRK